MIYTFTIPIKKNSQGKWSKLPGLNDFIKAERVTFRTKYGKFMTKGAIMKKEWQEYISIFIRRDLGRLKITKPVIMHYKYYEPDLKLDIGNRHATCQKFVEDALQECGVLINDNQRYVKGFTAEFFLNRENPKIIIELEEVD